MKKEMTYTELAKETAILTAAVAIIAAAVYFFLVPDIPVTITNLMLLLFRF